MSRKGIPRSAEDRAEISHGVRRYLKRKRDEDERAKPLPHDVRAYEQFGLIRGDHRAIKALHDAEHLEIRDAVGEAKLTPQRQALLRDHHRLGIVGSPVLGVYLRDPEQTDLASRLATIAGTRAKLLQLVGIERAQKDVPDLQTRRCERASELVRRLLQLPQPRLRVLQVLGVEAFGEPV